MLGGITLHKDWALASAVSASMHRLMYALSSNTYSMKSISAVYPRFGILWLTKMLPLHTCRISSVPNRDRKMPESMALTEPILRSDLVKQAGLFNVLAATRVIA